MRKRCTDLSYNLCNMVKITVENLFARPQFCQTMHFLVSFFLIIRSFVTIPVPTCIFCEPHNSQNYIEFNHSHRKHLFSCFIVLWYICFTNKVSRTVVWNEIVIKYLFRFMKRSADRLNWNRPYRKGSNPEEKRKIPIYDPWRFYYVEGIVCPDEFSQDEVDQNYRFA